MKVDRRIAIVATFAVAGALAQCKSNSTAPYDPRTYSVTSAPLAVPAVPTVPLTISTNDPNSHVSVVLPVATLQALVAAAGGAATVTMTDVAPPDFATKLPAGVAAQINSKPLTVLTITVAKSSAAASSVVSAARGSVVAAATSANPPIAFTIELPGGTTCPTAPVLYVLTSSGVLNAIDNTNFTIALGPPVILSGTTTQLALNQLSSILAFECPTATVTISGASGGNGN